MGKYIDAERLKAEIERLKGQLIRGACAAQIEMETNCKDEAYNEVLAFIDSLQQEQPEVDLELEIERISKNEEKFMKFQVRHQLIGYVARHFAEWGATHLNAIKEE